MIRRFYSLLHNAANKKVEMRREALYFTVFFLTAASAWLLIAAALFIAARHGLCDYQLVVRYIPEMVRSALISVPISVVGGLIFDLHLRENS